MSGGGDDFGGTYLGPQGPKSGPPPKPGIPAGAHAAPKPPPANPPAAADPFAGTYLAPAAPAPAPVTPPAPAAKPGLAPIGPQDNTYLAAPPQSEAGAQLAATLVAPGPGNLAATMPAGTVGGQGTVNQGGTYSGTMGARTYGGTVGGTVGLKTRINSSLPPDNQALDLSLQMSRLSVFQDVASRTPDLPDALRKRLETMESHGRYAVRRFLAQGGMGAVLEIDDGDFGRRSAVKIIKPSARSHPGILERFIEEARITAQLEHPNIVPIHDMGVLEDGTIFFTMKLIQGMSLGAVVKKLKEKDPEAVARWTEAELLLTFLKVLDGVGFAHSKKVIHRDLKPDNVMIDAYGEVLVVDWGIAKALAAAAGEIAAGGETPAQNGENLGATMQGQVMGSLHYMPPEQAKGLLEEIDGRSDVYALGATLLELLTTERPRRGNSVDALLLAAACGEHTPLAEVAPGMHPDLKAILERSMAPERTARYQTCADFAADIRSYMEGKAVAARQRSLLERSAAWIAAHKIQVAVGFGVVAITIGAAVMALRWKEMQDRQKAQDLASQANTLLNGEPDKAKADKAISLLTEAKGLVGNDADIAAALVRAENVREELDRKEKAAAQALARVRESRDLLAKGKELTGKGDYDSAEKALSAAFQLAPTDSEIDTALRDVRRILDQKATDGRRAESVKRLDEGRSAVARARTRHEAGDSNGTDKELATAGDAFALAGKDGFAPPGLQDAVADLATLRKAVADSRAGQAKRTEAASLADRAAASLASNALEDAREQSVRALGLDPSNAKAEQVRQTAVDRLRAIEEAKRQDAADAEAVGLAERSLAAARSAEQQRAAAATARTAAESSIASLARSLAKKSAADKAPLWAAHANRRSAAEAEASADATVENNALAAWNTLAKRDRHPLRTEAAAILADTYLRRMKAAESIDDEPGAAANRASMRRFDDGSRAAALDRPITVTVRGPASGTITVRRIAPGPDTRFAPQGDPVATIALPQGSGDLPAGRWALSNGPTTIAIWLRPGQPLTLRWPGTAPQLEGMAFRWVVNPDGSGFWLSDTEVTQEQYLSYVTAGANLGTALFGANALRKGQNSDLALVPRTGPKSGIWQAIPKTGEITGFAIPEALAGTPVTCVSADDAMAYCVWLSMNHKVKARLPTAAEWRQAATAGDPGRTWPWGQVFDHGFTVSALAGTVTAKKVGSRPEDVGPFGHHDLGGNVREWLAPDANEAVGDLNGLAAGGSYGDEKPEVFAGRYAERLSADATLPGIGFRILIEPDSVK